MWQKNISLKQKSSFRLGGKAKHYASVANEQELLAHLSEAEAQGGQPLIFGSLTNVLLPDEDLDWVIQLIAPDQLPTPDSQGRLEVWSGQSVARLANSLMGQGWAGLEVFTGLPGTIGGAIWNNAHFQTHFITDTVEKVRFFDQRTHETIEQGISELDFAYDHSNFQTQPLIILRADFRLEKADVATLQKKALEANQYRKQTQPLGEASAGCFWKNTLNNDFLRQMFPQFAPQKLISSGFLMDQAGLKGTSVGGAKVSERHAAFIVNTGGATSQDVKALATLIKKTVKEKFKVDLIPEVRIV